MQDAIKNSMILRKAPWMVPKTDENIDIMLD